MIAKERKVDAWTMKIDISLDIDLAGYMNKAPGLAARDVFRRIVSNAFVQTSADQATVDAIRAETHVRCPLVRLFDDAGTKIEGKWTKA